MHPRNYPRVSVVPKNAQNTEDNHQLGNLAELLLTYLLRQLAPTLAVAFHRDLNPRLQVLRVLVNHSATVVIRSSIS